MREIKPMIPTIGLMIAGYIIFRCVEIMCRPQSAFASAGLKALVLILGAFGILATGLLALNLVLADSSVIPRSLAPSFESQPGTSMPSPKEIQELIDRRRKADAVRR